MLGIVWCLLNNSNTYLNIFSCQLVSTLFKVGMSYIKILPTIKPFCLVLNYLNICLILTVLE